MHTHTYTHANTQTNIKCRRTHTNMLARTHKHTAMHPCTHACISMHMHTHIHAHAHTHIHTCIHRLMHAHKHTHTQQCMKFTSSDILSYFLGCCAGQKQALKPDPLKTLVGQNVTFTTTIDPETQQFVVITWVFNNGFGPISLISSATRGENVNAAYKDRVDFDKKTGSLVLRDVTTNDSGDYAISMVKDDGLQIPGEVKLTVYGESLALFAIHV